MKIDLSGKIAVVTGAKRGIGAAVAIVLAENGADIVINDISINCDDETPSKIRNMGRRVLCVSGDVGNEEDVENIFKKAVESFGKVDILANNAGITSDSMVKKMSLEQFQKVINVNLCGTFICSRQAQKVMKEKGINGSIVNFSSVVGFRGNVGQANYVSSKAGVFGLTKTLALEFAKDKIRVNAVAPGFIDTPMTQVIPDKVKETMIARIPLNRMGSGTDIANGVLFLVSELSDYITGQVLHINGGSYM